MKTLKIHDLTLYQLHRADKMYRGSVFRVYQSQYGISVEMEDSSHWTWVDNDWIEVRSV